MEPKRPAGRPGRYAKFESFEAGLPVKMSKRAAYCEGIGLFNGSKGCTVHLKIRLPHGGMHNGRMVRPGGAIEIKKGKRASWTWAELVDERNRLQKLADHGKPLEAVEVRAFSAYAKDWLDRKAHTLRSFGVTQGNVQRSLIPYFGKMALDKITVGDVNQWVGKQRATLKPSTVQRELNTLNAILNDAVRNGIIERNPAIWADKIKGIDARKRFVTADEWQTILRTIDQIELQQNENSDRTPHRVTGWLKPLVEWAYNSGMRRAEILGLTWESVRHMADDRIVVEVLISKNGTSRSVTCTDDMKDILDELGTLARVDGDIRLFPVSMTTVKRGLTKLWAATGLPDVRLHDLRRTHATNLMQKGIDPRTIAGRLGHTGTAMLAKTYAVYLGDADAAASMPNSRATRAVTSPPVPNFKREILSRNAD